MTSDFRSSNTARRFLRQPLALAVAAAFAAGIGAPAQAVVLFNVVDLGMPGDTEGSAFGVNAAGQVAGYANANSATVAFSWQGGARTALDSLGGTVSIAWSINDSGALVGHSSLPDATRHAVLWQNGGLTDLGTLGGSLSRAYGINNTGQIVGNSTNANGKTRAFLWSNGQMAELGTLGGSFGSARAINASGMVAGYSFTAGDAAEHATLWQNGSTVDLGTLGGSASVAYGINSSGAVTGLSKVVGNSAEHAVLWRNGGVIDLGTLGGKNSGGQAINASGQIVGYSDVLNGNLAHGFIWSASGMKDLNAFLTPGSGGMVNASSSINDNGQIAAQAVIGGTFHAVLLNPTGSVNWSNTQGGSFADGSAWDSGLGFAPTKFLDAVIAPSASQTIVVGSDATAKSLVLGAASGGRPTLQLQNGATLNVLSGNLGIFATGTLTGDGSINASVRNFGTVKADNVTITGALANHGLVTGDGRINTTLGNHTDGLVKVNPGQHLQITGVGHFNDGTVQVLGNANQAAALTVDGNLANGSTGRLFMQDAEVRFNGGLSNSGLVGMSRGNNNVDGAIDNLAGGRIVLSGNSSATFYDNVVNNGELRVSNGSTAVFFGLVKGAGTYTGTGTSYYEGGFHVGNSPALVTLNNATVFDSGSLLDMDIGGLTPGACDDCHAKLIFNASVAFLGGELKLNWWKGFSAQAGDRFDLFDFNAEHSGSFDLFDLPTLTNGLQWDRSQLYTTGEISVTGAVPEPETYALMLGGLALLAWRRRSQRRD